MPGPFSVASRQHSSHRMPPVSIGSHRGLVLRNPKEVFQIPVIWDGRPRMKPLSLCGSYHFAPDRAYKGDLTQSARPSRCRASTESSSNPGWGKLGSVHALSAAQKAGMCRSQKAQVYYALSRCSALARTGTRRARQAIEDNMIGAEYPKAGGVRIILC